MFLLVTLKAFLIFSLTVVTAVELTFELPDNAKQCFYEDIQQSVKANLEYQVVTGGHYDVDTILQSPRGEVLYRGVKKQADSYSFVAEETGVYKLCFSNEFSSVSHKLVYMDFMVGEEKPLPGIGEHLTAMTKVSKCVLFLSFPATNYKCHRSIMCHTQGLWQQTLQV